MTTFQLTAPGRRRPRPHRMAALRTTAGGLAYPVTQTDVDEQIVCIGCQTPFALGGYYAERPVAPDVAEIVCLRCAAAAPAQLVAAGPSNAAAIVYGQDRNLPDPEGWARATIPVVVVEGMPTGDGRLIPAESLSGHRALPIPLLSLSRTTEGGHLEATVAGRIDHLERVPGPDVMNVDTGQPFPEGTFVWRSNEAYVDPDHADYKLIYYGALSGLSVDLSETTAEFVENADDPEGEPLMQLRSGRIAASTACTIPAFPGAHLVLDPSAPTPAGARPTEALAASALPGIRLEHEGALCASCTAPPRAWFDDPGLTEPTPLTVTEDGRIYGHAAAWGVCHIGMPGGCTTAPRSSSGYRYFHLGSVLCDDGTQVDVGSLTMGTGHAGLDASAHGATEHYDNTGTVIADVHAGEDAHGIWLAGSVRPGVSDEQLRALRASKVSGDWRPIGSQLEMVAALCVNTPGFPIPRPRARVASGRPVALVAAGALTDPSDRKESHMAPPPTPPADDAPPATIEPGTPVVLGDSGLSGVVGEVTGDNTAIIAVEFPVADLTPADPPEGAELASMRKVVDAMNTKIRTLEAQRVLDRV